MTITRRWQAGAESNGASSAATEFDVVVATFGVSATQKRSGSYSYRIQKLDGSTYGQVNIAATYQIRIGLHIYSAGIPSVSDIPAYVSWRHSGGRLGSLRCDDAGDLRLYVASVSKDEEVGARPAGEWAHFGIDIKIDGSSGWVSVYKDGVKIMTFTGNTGSSQIEAVRFGTNISGVILWDDYQYLDDLFIDDTTGEVDAAVPDYRFEYITPDGDGNYGQCDIHPDGGEDHYEDVDDRPHDGDGTYAEADTLDEKDTYTMTTHSVPAGWAVNALIPVSIAKKSNAGVATQIALMNRYSGTDVEGSAQDLATTYGYIWERFTTKPGGGNWTQAALDAVEVGFVGKGTF